MPDVRFVLFRKNSFRTVLVIQFVLYKAGHMSLFSQLFALFWEQTAPSYVLKMKDQPMRSIFLPQIRSHPTDSVCQCDCNKNESQPTLQILFFIFSQRRTRSYPAGKLCRWAGVGIGIEGGRWAKTG